MWDILTKEDRANNNQPKPADLAAEAVVRLTLSLLAHPGSDGPEGERCLVERVLVPAVFGC